MKITGDGNTQAARDIIYNNFKPEEQYGVINTIFDFVLDKIEEIKIIEEFSFSRDKLIHINDKININFKQGEERREVQKYFTQLYLKISFVEKAFSSLSNDEQSDIHYYIFSNYNKMKRLSSVSPIEILTNLSDIFIPKTHLKNPNFQSIAQAIVLFFFDDCTIFEKTIKEDIKKDLFSDL